MQYTIRNIPDPLDAALRRSAREQGKSLNDVAIEALTRGGGLSERPCRQRDLSDRRGVVALRQPVTRSGAKPLASHACCEKHVAFKATE